MTRDVTFIGNLLSDGKARTLGEIDESVVDAGFGSKTSHGLELLIESIPDAVSLPGGRWVRGTCVLEGRFFTHHLSETERSGDILLSAPDLSLLQNLCLNGCVTFQGEPINLLDSAFDADSLFEAGFFSSEDDFALQLPLGALGNLVPDSLVVVGINRDGSLTIEQINTDIVSDSAGITAALLVELAKYESETPLGLEQLLLSMCCAHPDFFRTPVKPVSVMLEQAGLTTRESFVFPADFDFVSWDESNTVARLKSRYDLDENQARSVISLSQLVETIALQLSEFSEFSGLENSSEFTSTLDSIGSSVATDDTVLALRQLDHPQCAAALFGLVIDSDEVSSLPLLLAVHSWRHRAPRNSAAALGWLEGKALERMGDTDLAEGVYEAAESADSNWAPVLEELARFASDRGNAVRAVSLLERAGTPSDDDNLNILKRFAVASEVSDRNMSCWCGSGRRVKVCHRSAPPLPMEERAHWLHHKAVIYLTEGPYRGELLDVAIARSHYWPGSEGYLRGLGDPLVHDSMLCEGGVFEDFLDDRGHLLPEDEFELAQRWIGITRSVFDVEEVVLNQGLSLRDIRSGERTWVSERMATHSVKPGMLIATRLLPCGQEWQMYGSVEPVSLMQRAPLIALFDRYPLPVEVVAALSERYRPPRMTTTTGEPLVVCSTKVKVKEPKKFEKLLAQRYELHDDSWDRLVGNSIHASIRVAAGVVSIETMSEERMEIELDWIGGLPMFVKIISEETTTLDDLVRERPKGLSLAIEPTNSDISPELALVLAEAILKFEKDWLDDSIPALDGITPRNAAADPTRRSDLIALLKSFPVVEDGMSAQRIAQALGLDEYTTSE